MLKIVLTSPLSRDREPREPTQGTYRHNLAKASPLPHPKSSLPRGRVATSRMSDPARKACRGLILSLIDGVESPIHKLAAAFVPSGPGGLARAKLVECGH